MRTWRHLFGGAALALGLLASACSSILDPDPADRTRAVDGTVVWLDLEGGFYAIRGADLETYDPLNLPAEFQQHQLAVRAKLRIRSDLMSVHQVGPLVEVLAIHRR